MPSLSCYVSTHKGLDEKSFVRTDFVIVIIVVVYERMDCGAGWIGTVTCTSHQTLEPTLVQDYRRHEVTTQS